MPLLRGSLLILDLLFTPETFPPFDPQANIDILPLVEGTFPLRHLYTQELAYDLDLASMVLLEHHWADLGSSLETSADLNQALAQYSEDVMKAFSVLQATTLDTTQEKIVLKDLPNKLQYFFAGKLGAHRQLHRFPLLSPLILLKVSKELQDNLHAWDEVAMLLMVILFYLTLL